MLVSGVMATGTPATMINDQVDNNANRSVEVATTTANVTTEVKAVQNKDLKTNEGVESQVRAYFSDVPLLAEIAYCESRFRQYDKTGEIFRGKVNNQDVGVTQINEYYHLKRAKKLGYDIYTLEGNIAYAKLLYKEEGSTPWKSSSPCWSKSEVAQALSDKVIAEK